MYQAGGLSYEKKIDLYDKFFAAVSFSRRFAGPYRR